MTNGSLMKVESIVECSPHSAIHLTCIRMLREELRKRWCKILKREMLIIDCFFWLFFFLFFLGGGGYSLRPSQQFFSCVGMGLPGLNQY